MESSVHSVQLSVHLGGLIGVASLVKNGLLPSHRILTTGTNNTGFKVATIRNGGVAIFKICSINSYSPPFMGYIIYQDTGSGNKNLFFVKLFDTGTYIDNVKVARIENPDGSNTIYVRSPSVPVSLELETYQESKVDLHYEPISELPSEATIYAVEKALYIGG